ncbi:inter-alpha-trypsin inhibitor heavy chain-related protein, partial [Tanacetum coccineum]
SYWNPSDNMPLGRLPVLRVDLRTESIDMVTNILFSSRTTRGPKSYTMDSNSSIRCTADAWAPADIQAQDVYYRHEYIEMGKVCCATHIEWGNVYRGSGNISKDSERGTWITKVLLNFPARFHPLDVLAFSPNKKAAEETGRKLKVYVVEKNPNAIVTLHWDALAVLLIRISINQMKVIRKEVLFVVDISGSMKGRTIKATKIAVVAAMSKLDQGDSFNIMAFNDQTYLYSSTLELATQEALQKATNWIGMNFITGGGTNMSATLNQSIEMLYRSKKSLPIIFFITDGAIEDERQICEVMKKQLRSQGSKPCPRICTFGIEYIRERNDEIEAYKVQEIDLRNSNEREQKDLQKEFKETLKELSQKPLTVT